MTTLATVMAADFNIRQRMGTGAKLEGVELAPEKMDPKSDAAEKIARAPSASVGWQF